MNQTILGFQSAFYIRRGICQHKYGASKGFITFTSILSAVLLFTSDVCGGLCTCVTVDIRLPLDLHLTKQTEKF